MVSPFCSRRSSSDEWKEQPDSLLKRVCGLNNMYSKTGIWSGNDVRLGCYSEQKSRMVACFLYVSLKLAGRKKRTTRIATMMSPFSLVPLHSPNFRGRHPVEPVQSRAFANKLFPISFASLMGTYFSLLHHHLL